MMPPIKPTLKRIFGEVPLTAEFYWYLRQAGQPVNQTFSLQNLESGLMEWRAQALTADERNPAGKRVLIFATLHYWIEHATLIGLALAGLGHEVTLIYLPYGKWQKPINRFDLRRQNIYANKVLSMADPLVKAISLLDIKEIQNLIPVDLEAAIQGISMRDTQYTLQVEEVNLDNDLYALRLERNLYAAKAASVVMRRTRPEVLIIPNGSILEFGAVYQAAQYLDDPSISFPLVTYEFGEQRERIWLAQNAEVMRQQTDDMWQARKSDGLTDSQLDQVRSLFAARQSASLWENFARRWQGVPGVGRERIRVDLCLDDRPVVLLATNVIGDSLTLGRQVFSSSMTEWLERTVIFFADHPEAQLVVRIHPGELITKGPSVADVVKRVLPDLPENIHLVHADAEVNTYDIVDIADFGLVYTTTVGLELAMSGVPVIVIGKTHYRDKGFSLDPNTWESYFNLLSEVLQNPERAQLTKEQVDCAWEYAYRFFFDYPHPFPWHLVHMWNDVKTWSLEKVLGKTGMARFGDTLRYLVGEPVDWSHVKRYE
jgi:hypothetical protein